MSEENQNLTAAEMVRITAENLNEMMINMANHIDSLEKKVVQLTDRITELESSK